MSSRAASKSRWRRQQRERHERMFERSLSDGMPERSASASDSLKRPIAVWTLFRWYRQHAER